jgi:hypothetical protein
VTRRRTTKAKRRERRDFITSIALTRDQRDFVDQLADDTTVSRSSVVRLAINLLAERERRNKPNPVEEGLY